MPKPRQIGLDNGKFYPCYIKPVCVSTQCSKDDEKHYIEPIPYSGTGEEMLEQIEQIVKGMKRTKLLEKTENYLHFVFTTALFRFKDDVEFLIDDNKKELHFKSQSRIGGYDWNANRKRMEKIRTVLKK